MDSEYIEDLEGDTNLVDAMLHHIKIVFRHCIVGALLYFDYLTR
jgi:hypothetical protein